MPKQQQRRRLRNQPKEMDIRFEATGSVEITAALAGDTTPSVNIHAYTGGKLALPNFPHPAIIDVSGVKAMHSEQLPLLHNHDQDRVVGHGRPEIEATSLRIADGVLSVPGESRDTIIEANGKGFRWQASVGGRIPNRRTDVKLIPPGQTVHVNGQTFEGPVNLVKAFLWKETSFCSLGADEGRASAVIAARHTYDSEDDPMNEFELWLQASGFNADDLSDTQLGALKAKFEIAEKAAEKKNEPIKAVPEDLAASLRKDLSAELLAQSRRQRRIDDMFASYSDKGVDRKVMNDLRDKVEAGLISEDKAHLELIQASRANPINPAHGGGGATSAVEVMTLEAAVSMTAGVDEETIKASLVSQGATDEQADQALNNATTKRYRKSGIRSLIYAACRQAGHSIHDQLSDEDLYAALRHGASENIRASSGFSTVSLPSILNRVANAAMLTSYAEADSAGVATQIASVTSTSDFKSFSRYRMTEVGTMEIVPATGEIKHGELSSEEYENRIRTYGKIIALSRQMMFNDDLDAFLQIPRMLGRMGRHSLEEITVTTLVNAPEAEDAGTTEFFHGAARGNQPPNFMFGADTALSFDSLEEAYEMFLNAVDSDGKPIMIEPGMLLVGNSNIIMARKLYNDTEYRFTIADIRETINNQWKGMFQPVKSAYLSRLGTVANPDQWYLLANPTSGVAALQIAFLNGQRTPIIQQSEIDFNVLGVQYRGIFDFGVALQDPRGVVKSRGKA